MATTSKAAFGKWAKTSFFILMSSSELLSGESISPIKIMPEERNYSNSGKTRSMLFIYINYSLSVKKNGMRPYSALKLNQMMIK